MSKFLRLSLLVVGITVLAQGGQNGQGQNGQGQNGNYRAPEIDPNQAVTALALLSGGILIIGRKS